MASPDGSDDLIAARLHQAFRTESAYPGGFEAQRLALRRRGVVYRVFNVIGSNVIRSPEELVRVLRRVARERRRLRHAPRAASSGLHTISPLPVELTARFADGGTRARLAKDLEAMHLSASTQRLERPDARPVARLLRPPRRLLLRLLDPTLALQAEFNRAALAAIEELMAVVAAQEAALSGGTDEGGGAVGPETVAGV